MSQIPDIAIIYEDRRLINYSPFELYKTGSTLRLGINRIEDFYAMLFGSYGIEDIAFVDGEKAMNGDITELLKKEEDEFFDSMIFVTLGYIPSPEEIEDNYSCENELGRLMTFIDYNEIEEGPKKISDLIKKKYSNLTKPEGSMLSSFKDMIKYNGIAIDISAEYAIEYDDLRRDFYNIQCVGDVYKLYIHNTALLYPNAVFDTSAGPVVIDDGAIIKPGSYIEGPCYIGKNTLIDGGRIKDSSIFDYSTVRGRIEKSILYPVSEVGSYTIIHSSIIGSNSKIGNHCDVKDKDGVGIIIGDFSEILDGSLIPSLSEVAFGCKLNMKRNGYPLSIPPFIKTNNQLYFEEYSVEELLKDIEIKHVGEKMEIDSDTKEAIDSIYQKTAGIRESFINNQ